LDWLPEESYWSGLDETPSGTREDYRGALRDIKAATGPRGLFLSRFQPVSLLCDWPEETDL
jgi:hypothetical protein